jgi:hypothetical protein
LDWSKWAVFGQRHCSLVISCGNPVCWKRNRGDPSKPFLSCRPLGPIQGLRVFFRLLFASSVLSVVYHSSVSLSFVRFKLTLFNLTKSQLRSYNATHHVLASRRAWARRERFVCHQACARIVCGAYIVPYLQEHCKPRSLTSFM